MSEQDVVESDSFAANLEGDERAALEAAGIEPEAVSRKDCSYRVLLDAGVDDSVADDLRRRFSLPWSFETDGDLNRRSAEVRGLDQAERDWIAASSDDGWQSFEDVKTDPGDESEPDERLYPKPTPVSRVAGVGPSDAETLAEAGVNSAGALSRARAGELAAVLDLNVLHVRTWRYNARELLRT